MAMVGGLARLSDEEANDLDSRVERFRAAWKTDGSTAPARFLPPPGMRHRAHVLIQLIVADMELRALTGLPFRVEDYLTEFADDFSGAIPLVLLTGEYSLRHRFTDKPKVEEYRRRFPLQIDALVAELAKLPPSPQTMGPRDHTPITSVDAIIVPPPPPVAIPKLSTVDDGGRAPAAPQPAAHRPPAGAVGDLVITDSVLFPGQAQAPTKPRAADSTSISPERKYTLVRKIGKGAYGEVFEALAPGDIPVALKRILRPVDDPISKLEQDALDAIKKLAHPFLLKTNAYWIEGERLTVVMELAEYSLADRLEHYQRLGRTGVPVGELVPLFHQAAEALDYLHSQNVSHRDVKPENILVLRGYAKVADFGLVRQHKHTLTEVQNTAGTPAYMAPEMWKQKVSLHSDQYALAATYVRARLGRYLFNVTSWIDQGNAHVSEMPNLDPLPKEEQAVLLKALAKNPDDRWPSCTEFTQALRVAVFPPPPPPPVTPPRDSRWKAVLSTATIALVCAASVWAVSYFNRPPQPTPTTPDPLAQKQPEPKPPEKKYPGYPKGWQPVEADGDHPIGDRHFHNTLARTEAGQVLRARLIYPTNVDDPPPFYVTEHKITNKVFSTWWQKIRDSDEVNRIRQDRNGAHVPESWTQYEDKTKVQTDGVDAERPVLGVTVPEAMLVAKELGGLLPTHRQWLKATGLLERGTKNGPAGPALDTTGVMQGELRDWKRKRFQERKLALGEPLKPLPVGDEGASGDKSTPWQIRQLVTNGQEWLGEVNGQKGVRFVLSPLPSPDALGCVVGHSPLEDQIDTATYLQNTGPGPYRWCEVDEVRCGFRIILVVP
jgi:serine/threonine protein kinase